MNNQPRFIINAMAAVAVFFASDAVLRAQPNVTPEQLAGRLPLSSVPESGTFWLVAGPDGTGQLPPLPFAPPSLVAAGAPIYDLGDGQYIVDDRNYVALEQAEQAMGGAADMAMDSALVAPESRSSIGGGAMASLLWLDNPGGLYLEAVGATNDGTGVTMDFVIHPPQPDSFDLLMAPALENLGTPYSWYWIYRSGLGETNLSISGLPLDKAFFVAATTNSSKGDLLSDGWKQLSGLDTNTFYDANISFALSFPQSPVTSNVVNGSVTVSNGYPSQICVMLDSTNAPQPWGWFFTPFAVDFGLTNQARDVFVGLRGPLPDVPTVWHSAQVTVAIPPLIVNQPLSQDTTAGNDATLSVLAAGGLPMSFQWSKGGYDISGATDTSLLLTNLQSSDAGTYAVLVTNSVGTVLSSNAVITVNDPVCVAAPYGLAGWWQGEWSANDEFGVHNAAVVGSLSYDAGKVGQAFSFVGTNGYAGVPASLALDVGLGGGFTIECWIRPSDLTTARPLVEWNNGSAAGLQLWISRSAPSGGGNGSLCADLVDAYGVSHPLATAPGLLNTNRFQHVALTYDSESGTASLYFNGWLVTNATVGTITPQTSYNLYFGYSPTVGAYYSGLLDEVSLYNRALYAGEILMVYNGGSAGKCGSLPSPYLTPPSLSLSDDFYDESQYTVQLSHSQAYYFFSPVSGSIWPNPGSIPVTNSYADAFQAQEDYQLDSATVGVNITRLPSPVISPSGGYLNGSTNVVITIGQGNVTNMVAGIFQCELSRSTGPVELSSWSAYALGLRTGGWSDENIRSNVIGNLRQSAEYVYRYGATGDTYYGNESYMIEYSTDGGTNWQTYDGPITVNTSTNVQARVRKYGIIYGNRTQYAFLTSDPAQAQFSFIPGDWLLQYFGPGYQTNANAAPDADPDGDGLSNLMEYQLGCDPLNPDTDYDGRNDGQEVADGTNPADPNSAAQVRLGYWRFNTNSLAGEQGQLPLNATNVVLVTNWSGYAVQLDSPTNTHLSFRDMETNHNANINCRNGSVRFWVRPDWSSGAGPGSTGRLLEMGDGATNGDLWALSVSGDGTQLYFEARTNGVGFTNLTFDINWSSGDWHQLVLTYGSGYCYLYVDGQNVMWGYYPECWPSRSARSAYGFSLGSSRDGSSQSRGQFDELETFNYQLTGDAISANYWAFLNPQGSDVSATLPAAVTCATNLIASVTGGPTAQMAVLVNSTDFVSAQWITFGDSMPVNLPATDGVYTVYFGFKGVTGMTYVRQKQIIRDTVPPQLFLTCPTNISSPLLQLTGYGTEPLSRIRADVFNTNGAQLDQAGSIMSQTYDPGQVRLSTNYFQVFDLVLAPGTNTIRLRAADLAGNWATNIHLFTVDLSQMTNPPVLTQLWPRDGDTVSGNELTLRGHVDNPCATVTVQVVDAEGNTNQVIQAPVERDGLFWAEGLQLSAGTNFLTVTAVDPVGHAVSNSLTVIFAGSSLTIDDIPPYTLSGTQADYVSGTVNIEDCAVWVNGVEAQRWGNNGWSAYSVPLGLGGTAVIQARAIPNSGGGAGMMSRAMRLAVRDDSSPSGPQDDTPANPDGPGSTTAESQRDKAPITFISRLTGSYHYSLTNSADGEFYQEWNQMDFLSQYQTNDFGTGSFGYLDSWPDEGNTTFGHAETNTFAWPADPEHQALFLVNQGAEWDGDEPEWTETWLVTNTVTPAENVMSPFWMGEPVGASGMIGYAMRQIASLTNTDTQGSTLAQNLSLDYQYTETLKTEGKGFPGRRILLQLKVQEYEWEVITNQYGLLVWKTNAVAPWNSTVAGKTPSYDGIVYLVAAEKTNVDVTVWVPTSNYVASVKVVTNYVLTSWTEAKYPPEQNRTSLGVAEKVTVHLQPELPANGLAKAEWSLSGPGGLLKGNDWGRTTLYAPTNAANLTVTVTVQGESLSRGFSVFEPAGYDPRATYVLKTNTAGPFQPGGVGVQAHFLVRFAPTNVSFGNLEVMEGGMVATNATGWFADTSAWPSNKLSHAGHGANAWILVTETNTWSPHLPEGGPGRDYAGITVDPSSWRTGSFGFNIPVYWRVKGSAVVSPMPGWFQSIWIDAAGTTFVKKFGYIVSRRKTDGAYEIERISP